MTSFAESVVESATLAWLEATGWLAAQLPALPGCGIIYTLTKRDAVQVAGWLRSRGLDVASYTSETGEDRAALEQALLENRVKALVATTALGMGFDKPDRSHKWLSACNLDDRPRCRRNTLCLLRDPTHRFRLLRGVMIPSNTSMPLTVRFAARR